MKVTIKVRETSYVPSDVVPLGEMRETVSTSAISLDATDEGVVVLSPEECRRVARMLRAIGPAE